MIITNHRMRRLCFHFCLLVCLLVCYFDLFVCLCLFVSVCQQNYENKTDTIFRMGRTWHSKHQEQFADIMFNPMYIGYLRFFVGEAMPVSNMTEKRTNWFQVNFHDRSDMTQGIIWMLRLTTWIQDFVLFSRSMFVNNITEKRVNGISWHFHQI